MINPTPESQKPINTRLDDKGKCLEKRHYPDKFGGCEYEVVVASINTGKCPYKVGEIVAVAQSYLDVVKSDTHFQTVLVGHGIEGSEPACNNKMFVRADLMPHQVRILDIRAERLQDITEEDCVKEGIESKEVYEKVWSKKPLTMYINPVYKGMLDNNPREAYASLIDKISGRGTWERNPYVWRIEFELVK